MMSDHYQSAEIEVALIVISLHLRGVILLGGDNRLGLGVLVMIVVWTIGTPVTYNQFMV